MIAAVVELAMEKSERGRGRLGRQMFQHLIDTVRETFQHHSDTVREPFKPLSKPMSWYP